MDKNIKMAFIIGGVIIAILVIVPLIIGLIGGWQGYGYGYGMGPWMMWGFGGMWFMPIFMVIFWGLVIWGIVALARGASSPSNGGFLQSARITVGGIEKALCPR